MRILFPFFFETHTHTNSRMRMNKVWNGTIRMQKSINEKGLRKPTSPIPPQALVLRMSFEGQQQVQQILCAVATQTESTQWHGPILLLHGDSTNRAFIIDKGMYGIYQDIPNKVRFQHYHMPLFMSGVP